VGKAKLLNSYLLAGRGSNLSFSISKNSSYLLIFSFWNEVLLCFSVKANTLLFRAAIEWKTSSLIGASILW